VGQARSVKFFRKTEVRRPRNPQVGRPALLSSPALGQAPQGVQLKFSPVIFGSIAFGIAPEGRTAENVSSTRPQILQSLGLPAPPPPPKVSPLVLVPADLVSWMILHE